MRSLITVLGFFIAIHLNAQCFTSNDAFGDGEEVSYTVSYNWGPVWVDAGLVTFSAKKEMFLGKPSWHLKSTGKTFRTYDILFKVRDYYDSWVDPDTFHSFEFRRYIYEGGYTLLNTMKFDQEKHEVYSNTKTDNNPQRTDTLKILPCSFDMLSAVYYTRTLDLPNISKDFKKQIPVLIDDGYYNIYIRPLGKEIVENTDGKKYRCTKFAAKMVEGTIFRGDEDVLVWVTDDANKVPIYIEAKIIIGTVKAYLKEARGLKNPNIALIK